MAISSCCQQDEIAERDVTSRCADFAGGRCLLTVPVGLDVAKKAIRLGLQMAAVGHELTSKTSTLDVC